MYVNKNNQSCTFKIMKKVEEVVFILLKYKHITLRPLNIQIFNIQLLLNLMPVFRNDCPICFTCRCTVDCGRRDLL